MLVTEWSEFAAWWFPKFQDSGLPETSVVERVCSDLESRLGIAQGDVATPDYRDYLFELIEERYGSRNRFCQETGVDPGHLHFHVRMLLNAGLIELVEGQGRREKPYRAVASSIRVAPELISTGEVNDMRAAMLDAVQRGWQAYAEKGEFRSAQITVRIDPDRIRDAFEAFSKALDEYEDAGREPMLITVFAHPHAGGDA